MITDHLPVDDGQRASERPLDQTSRVGARSWWSGFRATLRAIQVRLRLVIIFAAAFLVIGNWETLSNYWDRLTTFATGTAPQAVSGNTEYFCPMCPGVISDWPSKCPVCNMALVRRKKGGPVQLPDGVVSRMQYSPYRLQLAGVRTSSVGYRPLVREITAPGFVQTAIGESKSSTADVSSLQAELQLFHGDAAMLKSGQAAEVHCPARPGNGPWPAQIRSVEFNAAQAPLSATVVLDIENPNAELAPGMEVSAHFRVPVADVEPFSSQPIEPEPIGPNEPRSVYVCLQHGDVLGKSGSTCPHDKLPLVERPLAENERLRYWCPMHPQITATEAGHKCDECGGMVLVPRVVSYRPRGEVLAVPESAVIDTGRSRVVYVDRGAGMFDGVEVVVGPRVEGFYSVVSGLQAGMKVAASGAFLLDAETRLHSNIAAAYFGATTNAEASEAVSDDVQESAPASDAAETEATIDTAIAQLAPDDQGPARRQRICPVTRLPLGSMGKPERVVVEGRAVFLCCAGCKQALIDDPGKYLAAIQEHDDSQQRP
jgi:hypothetical protein